MTMPSYWRGTSQRSGDYCAVTGETPVNGWVKIYCPVTGKAPDNGWVKICPGYCRGTSQWTGDYCPVPGDTSQRPGEDLLPSY
jgi:hypothetical protein